MISYFGFDSKFIDNENVISKLNLLFRLERMDPYANDSTLQERIQISLQYIPREYRQYVLALFANSIYFPNVFSKSVLQHLLNSLLFRYEIDWKSLGHQCLILEQDPTGIVNEFLRANHVHGRLDKQTFQRTQQVSSFVKTARINLKHSDVDQIEDVTTFLKRDYWIVLVDNSLSGTSLCSDLERLFQLSKDTNSRPKKIVLLIRTLTEMALNLIHEKFAQAIGERILEIDYGLLLDSRFVITPNIGQWRNCVLFNDKETYEGVISACKWLANQPEYKSDPLLADHKEHSGGDKTMTFGFKDCGITFVSSENCPSDSLPLLWYKKDGFYIPPFPRVLSRIGGCQNEK